MKRLFCGIMICIILLTGCWNPSESYYTEAVYFYYPLVSYDLSNGNRVISHELREGTNFSSERELLKHYLEGPNSSSLYSPFPVGASLVDYSISDDRICIYLSHHFNELTGMPYTIATSCIAMTILTYTGLNSVDINVLDANNEVKSFVTLTMDQILLNDTCTVPPAE
jgi:spore germination protein GerM